jgi:hypothetical protein
MTATTPSRVRLAARMLVCRQMSGKSATAKRLGHDPAVTLRVYGHVFDDALASAGDVLLGRSRGEGDG